MNELLQEISFDIQVLCSLADFQASLQQLKYGCNLIQDSLFSLQISLDILYNHNSGMRNQKLIPQLINPVTFSRILYNVSNVSTTSEKHNIYRYYELIKFKTVPNNDYLMGLLEIPLL